MAIHESIGYADYALKRFFQTASKMEWFKNTLFVFTADHTTEAYHDIYKSKSQLYSVPIIFFKPDSVLKKISNKTAQHTDIMPTILVLLNFDKDYLAFGHSLLDTSDSYFSVNYCDGIYQIIYGKYLLTFNGKESLALYNIEKDKFLQNNIINSTDILLKNEIENLLKAYIQSYQYRMVNNKFTID